MIGHLKIWQNQIILEIKPGWSVQGLFSQLPKQDLHCWRWGPLTYFLPAKVDNVLQGEHNQGENIADNGGLKVGHSKITSVLWFIWEIQSFKLFQAAYRTYKKLPFSEQQCIPGFNLTSDQLFWVTFQLIAFLICLFHSWGMHSPSVRDIWTGAILKSWSTLR